MKRILALVFMCGAGSCIAGASIDAAAATKTKPKPPTAGAKAKAEAIYEARLKSEAPADEYFGPLKLSIIGISNSIHDIGLRYDFNHDIPKPSFASAELTESAVRDWKRKYPHDPQLPRNVYFLQRLYTKILLQDSRDHAAQIAKLLFADFPTSPQAKQLKKTLAVEHLAPLPTPSPTPEPSPTEIPTVPASAEPTGDTSPLPAGDRRPDSDVRREFAPPPTIVPSGAVTPVASPAVPSAPATAAPASGTPATPAPGVPPSVAPIAAPSPIASQTPASNAPVPAPTSGTQPAMPSPAPTPVAAGTPAAAAATPLPSPLPSATAPQASPTPKP